MLENLILETFSRHGKWIIILAFFLFQANNVDAETLGYRLAQSKPKVPFQGLFSLSVVTFWDLGACLHPEQSRNRFGARCGFRQDLISVSAHLRSNSVFWALIEHLLPYLSGRMSKRKAMSDRFGFRVFVLAPWVRMKPRLVQLSIC